MAKTLAPFGERKNKTFTKECHNCRVMFRIGLVELEDPAMSPVNDNIEIRDRKSYWASGSCSHCAFMQAVNIQKIDYEFLLEFLPPRKRPATVKKKTRTVNRLK